MELLLEKLLAFSYKIYYVISAETNSSFVFSPYIIFKMLGILLNAAEGDTKEYLQMLLYQKDDVTKINQKFKELHQDLIIPRCSNYYLYLISEKYSNKNYGYIYDDLLFCNYILKLRTSLKDAIENFFNITPDSFNLENQNEEDDFILRFMRDYTKKNLPNFLKNFNAFISSYNFFKGSWYRKFDIKDTKDENFYCEKEVSMLVPMMKINKEFTALDDENYQAIELTYLEPGFLFLAVMPKKDQKLSKISKDISEIGFYNFFSKMKNFKVDLLIPKFRIESEYNFSSDNTKRLKKFFSRFNVLNMFDSKSFKKIDLIHKAVIEVNEYGTVSDAVKMPISDDKSGHLPKQISITFNKPFLYFILKKYTGNRYKCDYIPLFMGQYCGK